MIDLISRQMFSTGLLMLIAFGPVFTAGWLLQRRKRNARLLRRSPLTIGLLRSPGHSVRQSYEEMRVDVAFDIGLLTFIPVLPLAFFYLWLSFVGGAVPAVVMVSTLVLVGIITGLQIRSLLRRSTKMDRLRLGLDGELAAGQELDQLMRHGAVVFHDMPGDKFNIDHVVIAPQGVYAVETKGFSKDARIEGPGAASVVFDGSSLSFPGWRTKKPLDQAERQARWLAAWLTSSTGEPVHVVPVLVLPGWYVDRKGRGSVAVLSALEIQRNLLKLKGSSGIGDEQMQRLAHQVEQRCRNAGLNYAGE